MGTFELSMLIALVITAPMALLSLITLRETDHSTGEKLVRGGIAFFVAFWVATGINFLFLYCGQPAFVGPLHGMFWVIVPVIVAILIIGLINWRLSAAVVVVPIFLVVILGYAAYESWSIRSDHDAKMLAGLANIVEMDPGSYPETDADHILLVPEQVAKFKANQIIASSSDEAGRNLSTIYGLADPVLQSVDAHLYWILGLNLSGWRVANQVDRIVPGYIVVDAEDPNVTPQVRLGYRMEYTKGAPTRNSVERHIYNSGYRDWHIDDVTLEIRDDWQPFYTASLNKNAIRFNGQVPQKMIIVDPVTGDIEEHELNDIPNWVDRVYSKKVVNDFLSWWGHWSNAPWKFVGETSTNRMQPAGDPVLVYTKTGHPAWQVLMTSFGSDMSTMSIVLFEGRSNTAKVYPVSGIAIEEDVLKSFKTAKKNIKSFEPVHISIHKIYGKLTWVVSYISDEENINNPAPFQGLGLLDANDVQGANVIMAETKESAFAQYRQWLAMGSSSASPEENSLTKMVQGKIVEITNVVIDGNTNYLILLDSDSHLFQGKVGDNSELPFAQAGIDVTITYFDIGKQKVDIMSYDDPRFNLN